MISIASSCSAWLLFRATKAGSHDVRYIPAALVAVSSLSGGFVGVFSQKISLRLLEIGGQTQAASETPRDLSMVWVGNRG